jgi:hypothetical protein
VKEMAADTSLILDALRGSRPMGSAGLNNTLLLLTLRFFFFLLGVRAACD